jgi:hypothetical protein
MRIGLIEKNMKYLFVATFVTVLVLISPQTLT